jgi:hypothetical protein
MPGSKAVNLHVPIWTNVAIERWLAREVLEGRIRLGEASRNAVYERVLRDECRRIRRLVDHRGPEPLEPEGEREQVNLLLPVDVIEELDTYIQRQQEVYGHTGMSMSRRRLIVAALCREERTSYVSALSRLYFQGLI